MAVTENGVNAAFLWPLLGLGSYETAWGMCHTLRTAMGRTSRDLLSGDVEVDETYTDGEHLGHFLHRHVTPGPVVISDALRSFPPTIADTLGHKRSTSSRLACRPTKCYRESIAWPAC